MEFALNILIQRASHAGIMTRKTKALTQSKTEKTKNCGPNTTLIKKLIKKPTAKPTQKHTTTISSSEMNGVAKASCRMQSELDNAMFESELQSAK